MKKNKKKIIIIILPKNDNTSPIKGAVALANYLCNFINIKIIFLSDDFAIHKINKKIEIYKLKNNSIFKIFEIKDIIHKYRNYEINTLSLCLSADLINLIIKPDVNKISTSVRGNLSKAYSSKFRITGLILAKLHYFIISKFNVIFSMNIALSNKIYSLTSRKSIIAGNCIDEKYYKQFFKRKKKFQKKIIFMGSLEKNKNPMLLLRSFSNISSQITDAKLVVLGDGPLKKKLIKFKNINNYKNIKILGNLKIPYQYLVNSDLLVSTSDSEGISRSILEAMFLGIPVMISDVDGSGKIINQFKNGFVFKKHNDFFNNLKKVLFWSKTHSQKRKCLLPYNLRQNYVGSIYLKHLG